MYIPTLSLCIYSTFLLVYTHPFYLYIPTISLCIYTHPFSLYIPTLYTYHFSLYIYPPFLSVYTHPIYLLFLSVYIPTLSLCIYPPYIPTISLCIYTHPFSLYVPTLIFSHISLYVLRTSSSDDGHESLCHVTLSHSRLSSDQSDASGTGTHLRSKINSSCQNVLMLLPLVFYTFFVTIRMIDRLRQKSWSPSSVSWQHIKLSDVSLATRSRYSLVVDKDVKKPNKQTILMIYGRISVSYVFRVHYLSTNNVQQ